MPPSTVSRPRRGSRRSRPRSGGYWRHVRGGDTIRHDLTIEKLEIARTIGLVTKFTAHPMGRVTVSRSAHVSEAGLRTYLQRLLPGLDADQAIMIEAPSSHLGPAAQVPAPSPRVIVHPGSALPGRPRYLDGLATAGALLICAAVVLNVGPFAHTAKPFADQAVANIADPGSRSASVAQAATRPESSQTVAQPEDVAKPIVAAAQLPMPSVEVVSAAVKPRALGDVAQHIVEPVVLAAQSHAGNANPAPAAENTIVGVWAPDAGACSAHHFRDGALPTVITSDGASAGDTFCLFTKQQRTEDGWRVVATCSNPRERWTSHVRLTVNDHRLTWSSKRGVQAYARCTPDLLVAKR